MSELTTALTPTSTKIAVLELTSTMTSFQARQTISSSQNVVMEAPLDVTTVSSSLTPIMDSLIVTSTPSDPSKTTHIIPPLSSETFQTTYEKISSLVASTTVMAFQTFTSTSASLAMVNK